MDNKGMDGEGKKDDDWTGSGMKPWLNPPMDQKLGAGRGSWKWGMLVIGVAVAAVIVVLILVDTDRLSRGWAYAVLPIAIIAAAASRVLTIFKAGAEDKTGPDNDATDRT
jgi:hypothetical protein